MRWLAVLLVLGSLRADAKPRLDYYDQPVAKPCPQTRDWTKLVRCEHKTKHKLELVHDTPTAKLVAWQRNPKAPLAAKVLELWFLIGGYWVKSGFYAETNPSMEVLSFGTIVAERYRIDLGYATSTWVTLDEVSSRPALLKRRYAYLCSPTGGCVTAHYACEVQVRGKTIAGFRGEPVWEGNALKIRGDARATNRYCTKPSNFVQVDVE